MKEEYSFMNMTERKEKLMRAYAASHPLLTQRGVSNYCLDLLSRLSDELLPVMDEWLHTGKEIDFKKGRFSIADIMDFRECCYVDALALMNSYLLDPVLGEALILPY